MNRKFGRLSLFMLCLALSAIAIENPAKAWYPCEEGAQRYFLAGCCPDGYGFYWEAHEVYVCQDGFWIEQGIECVWKLC